MKTVRVDMKTKKISIEDFDTSMIFGNRGLIAKTLVEEVDPACDPLGKENKLIFATGIFAGYGFPSGNRLSAGAKSPLTGTIKESNVGGTAGTRLAAHGIKMVIIENEPEDDVWYLLKIAEDGSITLEDASIYSTKGTYETVEKLKAVYGNQSPAICTIGPAGERQNKVASIQVTDFATGIPARACGRGGLGAVMGSKHVKAIVIEKAKWKIDLPMVDATKVKSLTKELYLASAGNSMRNAGTYGAAEATIPMNAYPVQNFSGRMLTDQEQAGINLAAYLKRMNSYGGKQGVSCQPGCPVGCSNIYNDENGEIVTSGLEYETIALSGPNCNIFDWDYIAEFDHICDDLGVDTIDVGAAIGVAMDAGYIPWGDAEAAKTMLNEMIAGEGFGRILADGARATGDYLNYERVPVCKGQSIPAYDPRAIKGAGVTFASFAQGADHTAGLTLGMPIDHADPNIQIEASKNLQFAMAMMDNICCLMNSGILFEPESAVKVAELVTAIYGVPFVPEMLGGIGYQTCVWEREFNALAGLCPEDDKMPQFFREEPLELTQQVFDVKENDLKEMWS